nr:CinA family protein [Propionibacterium sp.]
MTDLLALAKKVLKTLTERDLTLATAESLTGGLLGATITEVPGASKVYLGGAIAYTTPVKESLLAVDHKEIEAFTVVSSQVASGMASGIHDATGADWCIAVTGVAGPDPSEGHDPGEVWICVRGPQIGALPPAVHTQQFQFAGDRQAVRQATVEGALSMLLRVLSPV